MWQVGNNMLPQAARHGWWYRHVRGRSHWPLSMTSSSQGISGASNGSDIRVENVLAVWRMVSGSDHAMWNSTSRWTAAHWQGGERSYAAAIASSATNAFWGIRGAQWSGGQQVAWTSSSTCWCSTRWWRFAWLLEQQKRWNPTSLRMRFRRCELWRLAVAPPNWCLQQHYSTCWNSCSAHHVVRHSLQHPENVIM